MWVVTLALWIGTGCGGTDDASIASETSNGTSDTSDNTSGTSSNTSTTPGSTSDTSGSTSNTPQTTPTDTTPEVSTSVCCYDSAQFCEAVPEEICTAEGGSFHHDITCSQACPDYEELGGGEEPEDITCCIAETQRCEQLQVEECTTQGGIPHEEMTCNQACPDFDEEEPEEPEEGPPTTCCIAETQLCRRISVEMCMAQGGTSHSGMTCSQVCPDFIGSHEADAFIQPQTSPLSIVPEGEATHTVVNSGNWTDPNTWSGRAVPDDMAKVLIPEGLTLTVDQEIATRLKAIRNDGKLQFSPSTNTALNVETIVQGMRGELNIGTADNPIPEGRTARITIIDAGDLNLMSDQWEKGLLLMGKTVAYGAAKTAWSQVTANPARGATTINLQQAPSDWRVGDRIVIAGTDPVDPTSDEVAVIASISGSEITLSQPLSRDHLSPAPDLLIHVANLSRNVLIESEGTPNPLDRGHIMFMHTLDVDFNHVRLHKMGRTRKDIPIDDWFIDDEDENENVFFATNSERRNIRGRYSIHFHRGGVSPTPTPAHVSGCVVEDDPGWAYVNHSSNVHFDNNISYNVIGGGFQTEAGDELGSFTNNIAIRTVNTAFPLRQEAPEDAPDTLERSQDFAFQGDGFWVHGGGVSLSGNVASGSSGHGFIYWPEGLIEPHREGARNVFRPENLGLGPDITTNMDPERPSELATGWVQIAGFSNNETYSSTIGLATFYLHTTFFNDMGDYDPSYLESVHSTFEDFTAWNLHRQGIQLNFTERVSFRNIRLVNSNANAETIGIWASHYRSKEEQLYQNISIEGFGTGFMLPPQGKVTVECGNLRN
ncbi:MAG: G8 domain-containing protein, partial [Myxococcota bacterium]